MRWDESSAGGCHQPWRRHSGRFVVMTQGSYNRPKLPGIPGIKDFKGHIFHSARWDYDYTGGDANGGLHKLHDKRVALVGTGATGVQLVPHLGRDAQHLYVFSANPSSVDVRGNEPTDPQWAASLSLAGRRSASATSTAGHRSRGVIFDAVDQVCDFWTELGRNRPHGSPRPRIRHR